MPHRGFHPTTWSKKAWHINPGGCKDLDLNSSKLSEELWPRSVETKGFKCQQHVTSGNIFRLETKQVLLNTWGKEHVTGHLSEINERICWEVHRWKYCDGSCDHPVKSKKRKGQHVPAPKNDSRQNGLVERQHCSKPFWNSNSLTWDPTSVKTAKEGFWNIPTFCLPKDLSCCAWSFSVPRTSLKIE